MSKVTLVTGGSRSGKSNFAQQLAEQIQGPRLYVATCPVFDEELKERVRKHQETRSESNWDTLEEQIDLPGAIRHGARYSVILVDCLTLWINNLIYSAGNEEKSLSENEIIRRCEETLEACVRHPGCIIFVTNETGMGIVPENALSRRFRDLAGRTNQVIAAGSDEVFLVVSGQPLRIKPQKL